MKQTYRSPTWLRIAMLLAIGWGMQLAVTATAGHATWIVLGCIAGAIAAPLLIRRGVDRILGRDRRDTRVKIAAPAVVR